MSGSRSAAINAFCKQCIYDRHAAGNWRQQVEACGACSCPLYEFRPKSSAGDAIDEVAVGEAA